MPAIQHLAVTCRDRHASEAFYAEHFGFRRARVFNRGTDNEFVIMRLGETCLELFQAPAEHSETRAAEPPIGFKHLAFMVDDLDGRVARLQAAGFATDPIIDCARHVPGMRVCFFNDPDGNRLELMEGYADEANPV